MLTIQPFLREQAAVKFQGGSRIAVRVIFSVCLSAAALAACKGGDSAAPGTPAGRDGTSGSGGTAAGSGGQGGRTAAPGGSGGNGGQASAGKAGARGEGGTSGTAGNPAPTDGGTQDAASPIGGRMDASLNGTSRDAAADTAATFTPCAGKSVCKIMPLGDSITNGWNSKLGGGYREGLLRLARADKRALTYVGSLVSGAEQLDGVPFPRENEGHAGWSIDDAPDKNRSGISSIVDDALATHKPDIILLHIGTNDIISTIDFPHMNDRLERLIDRIEKDAPAALLVVAQIIPVGGSPPFTDDGNQQVKSYNAQIQSMVARRRAKGEAILGVDMWTPFATSPVYGDLAGDGWHPSDKGYDVMAKVWFDAIGALLPRSP